MLNVEPSCLAYPGAAAVALGGELDTADAAAVSSPTGPRRRVLIDRKVLEFID
jgi:hypothetical protein